MILEAIWRVSESSEDMESGNRNEHEYGSEYEHGSDKDAEDKGMRTVANC